MKSLSVWTQIGCCFIGAKPQGQKWHFTHTYIMCYVCLVIIYILIVVGKKVRAFEKYRVFLKNITDDPRIQLFNRLYARKRKELKEKEKLKGKRRRRLRRGKYSSTSRPA